MKAKIRSTLQSISQGRADDIKVASLKAAFEYGGAQIEEKASGLEITLSDKYTVFCSFKPQNRYLCSVPSDREVIKFAKSTLG